MSGKIIGLFKPTFDFNGNMDIETNSKEVIINSYKGAFENLGKELSDDKLLSLENGIIEITSNSFKNILLENNLLDKFLKEVYSYNDKDLTEHINFIFNL